MCNCPPHRQWWQRELHWRHAQGVSDLLPLSLPTTNEGQYDKDYLFHWLKSESEIQAGKPLLVAEGEISVANLSIVVYDGETSEHVGLYLLDDRTSCRDDKLRELLVQVCLVIAQGIRIITESNECGQGRDVEQPVPARHEVVAITSTQSDICYLVFHRNLVGNLSMLPLG